MRIFLLSLLLLLSSCRWYGDGAIKGWTSDTIELLLDMSHRTSMINDTPLKTMEELDSPSGVELTDKQLCMCAADLYGSMMTVIANDVKESSIKSMCKSMGKCFFKSKTPEIFPDSCKTYVEKGSFQKLARDRSKSVLRLTKARRLLSDHCSTLK